MTETIRHKPHPVSFICIGLACLALSGCNVFGHEINNGIWFPILIVTSFIVFIVWRIRRHGKGRNGAGRTAASGWADGADASGHGGHTMVGNDDGGGDDGGSHHS